MCAEHTLARECPEPYQNKSGIADDAIGACTPPVTGKLTSGGDGKEDCVFTHHNKQQAQNWPWTIEVGPVYRKETGHMSLLEKSAVP